MGIMARRRMISDRLKKSAKKPIEEPAEKKNPVLSEEKKPVSEKKKKVN